MKAPPQLVDNLASVEARIAAACARAGRPRGTVQLLAVTKSVEPELAECLHGLGQRELAENRVDELERKAAWFREPDLQPRWHFVGHLQRNKARRVLQHASEIHSVESLALLETLGRICREEGRRTALWLQLKLHPEEQKGGLLPHELPAVLQAARAFPELECRGLMTMAPLVSGAAGRVAARAAFAALRELARRHGGEPFSNGHARLSMGMSGDFEIAIEEGADVLRIGSALFDGVTLEAGHGN